VAVTEGDELVGSLVAVAVWLSSGQSLSVSVSVAVWAEVVEVTVSVAVVEP
jgi:hypothetical protein